MSIAKWILFFSVLASSASAEPLKVIFNPFTGRIDYITRIDSNTVQGGSGITVTSLSTGAVIISGSGGTPGLPFNSVQYNNAGMFGGNSNFNWSGSSLTVISTMVVTNGGTGEVSPGLLDVWANDATGGGGRILFTVGSNQQGNQFAVIDQQPLSLVRYGANTGQIQLGLAASPQGINSNQSTQQIITLWASGDMNIQTATTGNGGKSIVFLPNTTEMLRLGGSGMTVTSSMTVVSGTAGNYEARFGTATVSNVSISTNGFVSSFGPIPTVASCGSGPSGTVVGDDRQGVITVGGTAPTACTLNFSMTHTGCTMVCNVTDNSLTVSADISSLTTSALTLGFGVGGLAGGQVYFRCSGYGANCK